MTGTRKGWLRGIWAERLSVLALRLAGWSILARRHQGARGSGLGEIDIVARRGRSLAFIEVKARADHRTAAEAISTSQQQRLARAAAAYLAHRPHLAHLEVRFDAMLVLPWHWPIHLIDAWQDGRNV